MSLAFALTGGKFGVGIHVCPPSCGVSQSLYAKELTSSTLDCDFQDWSLHITQDDVILELGVGAKIPMGALLPVSQNVTIFGDGPFKRQLR